MNALVEELWNSDLGLREETWSENTWDEGGFGDQYAGSLDDFVDQLCGGVPTSTLLGSQTRLGMTCGMILGILLRWRSLNFPKGMKAPLRLRLALLVPRLEQLRLLHHQDLHFPKPRQGLPRLQLLQLSARVGAVVLRHFHVGASLQSPDGTLSPILGHVMSLSLLRL